MSELELKFKYIFKEAPRSEEECQHLIENNDAVRVAMSALDLSDIFLNKAANSEKDFDQRVNL